MSSNSDPWPSNAEIMECIASSMFGDCASMILETAVQHTEKRRHSRGMAVSDTVAPSQTHGKSEEDGRRLAGSGAEDDFQT